MGVALSASLLRRGACFHSLRVFSMDPGPPSGRSRSYFWHAPWLAVWPSINHWHLSISLMARQLLKHLPLSPVSQPVSCYRLDKRTELCHLSEESSRQLLIFFGYDWINLEKIHQRLRGRWYDFSLHPIKRKKHKKTQPTSKPIKHPQNFWERFCFSFGKF